MSKPREFWIIENWDPVLCERVTVDEKPNLSNCAYHQVIHVREVLPEAAGLPPAPMPSDRKKQIEVVAKEWAVKWEPSNPEAKKYPVVLAITTVAKESYSSGAEWADANPEHPPLQILADGSLVRADQSDTLTALKSENQRLREDHTNMRAALELIASYGKENDGICPYGCDTPHLAEQSLANLKFSGEGP